MRRAKAAQIYRRTRNLRAVQSLLGHTKLESTVRYLGIEVGDALEMVEQTEVSWLSADERALAGQGLDSQRCSEDDAPTAVVFQIPDNWPLPLVWSADRSMFPCPLNPVVKPPTRRHRLRR